MKYTHRFNGEDPKELFINYLNVLYKKSKKDAITDGLTELYNHRHFKDSLEKEIERSERYKCPLSLLMIDVDNFKKYNDEHGHQEGDKLLSNIASALKKNTRKVDLIARYGGEEFAVIMPSTPRKLKLRHKVLNLIGERLLDAVRNLDSGTITISIGATTYNEYEGAYNLIYRADQALYKAKNTGKNKFIIK